MKASRIGRRNLWLYAFDLVLAVTSAVLAASSVALWLVLPQGYYQTRAVWLAIHRWSGLAVSTAVLCHLALHLRWIRAMTTRVFGGGHRPNTAR